MRLFHVSDIHFGCEDQGVLDWFAGIVRAERPDAIVVTGDLTLRARRHEFEAAARWLESLGRPVTVEVGNHDLPFFNPWARFVQPYSRYDALERLVERPLEIKGVAIVPLRTTARFQWRLDWSKGYLTRSRVEAALALLDAAPAGAFPIIACHHPLVEAGTRGTARTRGGAAALAELAEAGARAVLTGHVHDPFDVVHDAGNAVVRLIGAGTLSRRVRATPASFNTLTISAGELDVSVRVMRG